MRYTHDPVGNWSLYFFFIQASPERKSTIWVSLPCKNRSKSIIIEAWNVSTRTQRKNSMTSRKKSYTPSRKEAEKYFPSLTFFLSEQFHLFFFSSESRKSELSFAPYGWVFVRFVVEWQPCKVKIWGKNTSAFLCPKFLQSYGRGLNIQWDILVFPLDIERPLSQL